MNKKYYTASKHYGIKTQQSGWVFGICETSKNKAWNKLFDKIGNDGRKWRFECKRISDKDLVEIFGKDLTLLQK